MNEKLISAVKAITYVKKLKGRELPVLWYSNLNITDSGLNIIRKTEYEKRIHTLERILLRQGVPGCNMVMNSELRNLIVQRLTEEIIKLCLHDALEMPIVIAAGGALICEPKPYIYYRRHGNNVSGGSDNFMKRFAREWKHFKNGNGWEARLFKVVLKLWGDKFTPEALKTLTRFAAYKENWLYRLEIVFSPRFRTGDIRHTIWAKLRVLFGKL